MPDADPRFASWAARFEHIDEIYEELSAILKTRTTSEWLELFFEADIPAMPMHSFAGSLQIGRSRRGLFPPVMTGSGFSLDPGAGLGR
jgi:crotonobetainyl-CoA:carnitine CoA-transferase CaiB-like acyl-CoA transferase